MISEVKSDHIAYQKKRFAIVLLEEFAISSYGPLLDVLRIANHVSKKELYHWITIAENEGPIESSARTKIQPDFGLIDLRRGDIALICGGLNVEKNTTKRILNWIRRQSRRGILFGGVDTGSYTVAKAGLLEGKNATIHWENQDSFREIFHKVNLNRSIFCIDNPSFTSAGGCTSIDMILKLIETDHGEEIASSVSDQLIYKCHADEDFAQRLSTSTDIGQRNPIVLNAIRIMEKNLEDPISIKILSKMLNISHRMLERKFQRFLNTSPYKFYLELRLRKAKNLLLQTDISVINVAFACGFVSPGHFSKSYKSKYGLSPFAERKSR